MLTMSAGACLRLPASAGVSLVGLCLRLSAFVDLCLPVSMFVCMQPVVSAFVEDEAVESAIFPRKGEVTASYQKAIMTRGITPQRG